MKYRPDGWRLLKLTGANGNCVYKVFGVWNDFRESWRLSSGVDDLSDMFIDGDFIVSPQCSGSTYYLTINQSYCFTSYQDRALGSIKSKVIEEGGSLELVNLQLASS